MAVLEEVMPVELPQLFHNNLFHYRKMQDYSYLNVSVMALTNLGITPHSHNLKQLKNAPGQFPVQRIPIKSRIQHLFFASCLFRFASVKSALTGFLLRISKVKTVNIEH